MSLFTVNLNDQDRKRIDRVTDLIEGIRIDLNMLLKNFTLVIRVNLEPNKKDDIQK